MNVKYIGLYIWNLCGGLSIKRLKIIGGGGKLKSIVYKRL